jgi:hypothetical protein
VPETTPPLPRYDKQHYHRSSQYHRIERIDGKEHRPHAAGHDHGTNEAKYQPDAGKRRRVTRASGSSTWATAGCPAIVKEVDASNEPS